MDLLTLTADNLRTVQPEHSHFRTVTESHSLPVEHNYWRDVPITITWRHGYCLHVGLVGWVLLLTVAAGIHLNYICCCCCLNRS